MVEQQRDERTRSAGTQTPRSQPPVPEVIDPPDLLKPKVTPGGPTEADFRALERAESIIAELADRYLEVVDADLSNIQGATSQLQGEAVNASEHVDRIYHIAHDMKGQGGSFGYPLVTTISKQLCQFIEDLDKTQLAEDQTQAIALHVDALNVVIREKLKEAEGEQAKALLAGLRQVVEKVSNAS